MILCIIITQVMLLVISFVVNRKNIFKWILLFNSWWILLLLLNTIAPYGGYKTSGNGEFLIWIFLIFTTIGYIWQKNKKAITRKNENDLSEHFDKLILKNIWVKMLMLVFTLILSIYAIKFERYINSTNVLNTRIARYYVGGVFNSTVELLFFNYVVAASRFFSMFVIAYGVIFGRIKNTLFFLSAINLFLYSFIGGSRFPFVMLGVEMIIIGLYKKQFNRNKNSSLKINWKKIRGSLIFLICVLAVAFMMLYFTAYRLGMTKYDAELLWESFDEFYNQSVGYNIGPIAALDKTLENGILKNHFYLGQAVLLNGIDEMLANVFSVIGIPYSSARYALGALTATPITLGNSSFNALYTCVFWFYSDMGIAGVILYSLLFGLVVGRVVRLFEYKPSLWGLMLNSHILYFFIMSNMTWEINTVDSLIYILLIVFYFRKKERII